MAGPLAGPQAKPSHLLVSWIWQSKVWASLWSPPPARVVWPLRPLAEVGAPASGAASGMASSSPAGGPGHGGASLPPPSVYNETVGETVQGQSKREWDGMMVVGFTRSPHLRCRCPGPPLIKVQLSGDSRPGAPHPTPPVRGAPGRRPGAGQENRLWTRVQPQRSSAKPGLVTHWSRLCEMHGFGFGKPLLGERYQASQ